MAPTNVGATEVTLNGSFSGATGTISDHGFYYRKSSESEWTVVHLNGTTSQGDFSASVSGLTEGTDYIVKAFVEEMDASLGYAVDLFGNELTFTTTTSGVVIPTYLDDYGIPNVSGILSGTGTSGTYSNRGDHWFRYNTKNSKRQIAVHTYEHPSTDAETVNYVLLYDENNYAPLWTAHTMNSTYWPDRELTGSKNWGDDPAISLTEIDGLDDNNTYSRGHFVASSYRRSSLDQNNQTYYYTNKAPQYQTGFNQGVWSDLENRVKTLTPSGTTMLYIVVGVLYEESWYSANPSMPRTLKSGTKNVPIPSHFYKCIMKCTFKSNGDVDTAQGIAFVYSNQSHSGCDYYGKHTFSSSNAESFVTSINAIEQRAGFDFFAKIPDNLEDTAESNTDHRWFTGQTSL